MAFGGSPSNYPNPRGPLRQGPWAHVEGMTLWVTAWEPRADGKERWVFCARCHTVWTQGKSETVPDEWPPLPCGVCAQLRPYQAVITNGDGEPVVFEGISMLQALGLPRPATGKVVCPACAGVGSFCTLCKGTGQLEELQR